MNRWKCMLCGRDSFDRKSPHNCKGGFRKKGIEWVEILDDDEDGLTDDELLIKDLKSERNKNAINFAKWLAKEWMSMWVEDRWLWENVSTETNDKSLWKGYYTEEELYEIYLKETYENNN